MFWNQLLFLSPYIISTGITLWVFVYTWRHRQAHGANAYLWFVGAESVWAIGFLFETLSRSLQAKIFWDAVQWLPPAVVFVAFPAFTIAFTDVKIKQPRRWLALGSLIPVLFTLLVLTDHWHHLVYPNPHLVARPLFAELTYNFTWVTYAFSACAEVVAIVGLVMLVRAALAARYPYRWQILTIAGGFLIPFVGAVLTIMGVDFKPYRDISTLMFGIGNLIIAWGLFRFRTFEVIPIARDIVIENMQDQVVVLDRKDRIVDINQAALRVLGTSSAQVVGKPATVIYADWPELLQVFDVPGDMNTALTFQRAGGNAQYEVKSTMLYDGRGGYIGRVFVGRDLTEHIQLEQSLLDLNTSLEQRVKERTYELAESYDRTLEGWAKALELRDEETEGHSRRVVDITLDLARAMGVSEDALVHIRRGAILHDIGKMAIPDEILCKPGPLSPEEMKIVRKHPETAYQLLVPIPFLRPALDIPYCHHERWNGQGYPRGLKRQEIPLAARIFSVVDIWDALQSKRPYHEPWSEEKTIQYLKDIAGDQLDPQVVQKFLELPEEKRKFKM